MDVVTNIKEFDEIIKNNKKVVVDFFATWCGPCQMLSPIIEKLEKTEKDIKFIKVDVDLADEKLVENYNVFQVPTLIYFKNGEPTKKQYGFKTKEQLLESFEAYLQ